MANKREYCTIYLLTNKVDGKKYVGQSWYDLHIRMGKTGENYKNSKYLYNAIQCHGVENFEYTILEKCLDQLTANKLEEYYMEEVYNTRDLEVGYNLKEAGSNGSPSEETRKKISETMLNKEWSPEALAAKSAAGKQWAGKIRGPQTEERKEQTSVFMTDWHENNEHPMQGKEQTEAARVAIGNTIRGTKRDPKSVAQGAAKHKIKEEFVKTMIAAYQEAAKSPNGVNAKALAEQLGTNTTTLYRKLKENGIKLASPNLSAAKTGKPQNKPIIIRPPIQTVIPNLTRDQVIMEAYKNEIYSIKDIETAFTITAPTIYVIAEKLGVPKRINRK
jgi:group I intron endonuclease